MKTRNLPQGSPDPLPELTSYKEGCTSQHEAGEQAVPEEVTHQDTCWKGPASCWDVRAFLLPPMYLGFRAPKSPDRSLRIQNLYYQCEGHRRGEGAHFKSDYRDADGREKPDAYGTTRLDARSSLCHWRHYSRRADLHADARARLPSGTCGGVFTDAVAQDQREIASHLGWLSNPSRQRHQGFSRDSIWSAFRAMYLS